MVASDARAHGINAMDIDFRRVFRAFGDCHQGPLIKVCNKGGMISPLMLKEYISMLTASIYRPSAGARGCNIANVRVPSLVGIVRLSRKFNNF